MNENFTAKSSARCENIMEAAQKTYELLKKGEACTIQARQTESLIEKLKEEDITVAVIGQFKRGKSTLSNAILGDKIMPVGIVPITSAVTKVKYGEKAAEVHFVNGAVKHVDFDELSEYISEQENEDNKLGVKEVILHSPSEFLKNGLTYVDTPGVGSFHKNNTEVAYEHMKESDAVIFLLSVDSPINQIEIDFLYNTREYAGKFYFAVNKVDVVDEKDLDSYMKYCKKVLRELMDTEDITLFPISSKKGIGIEELKNAILRDCDTSIKEIMENSTKKKLRDIIASALNQLDFYWKAMNMAYEELDAKFEEMKNFIAESKEKASGYEAIFEIHLNELKLKLSEKVYEVFGMEYSYDIEQMRMGASFMNKEEFMEQVNEICEDLEETLNRILLYREENAYVVVRKINDINRLTRSLRRIKTDIEAELK